jgi:hypothetical protein
MKNEWYRAWRGKWPWWIQLHWAWGSILPHSWNSGRLCSSPELKNLQYILLSICFLCNYITLDINGSFLYCNQAFCYLGSRRQYVLLVFVNCSSILFLHEMVFNFCSNWRRHNSCGKVSFRCQNEVKITNRKNPKKF